MDKSNLNSRKDGTMKHRLVSAPRSPYNLFRKQVRIRSIPMKRSFHVIIEKDDSGYFVGVVPELPGCHSQARTLGALTKRIKEAIELYLEAQKETPRKSNFVAIKQIEIIKDAKISKEDFLILSR
jgi:predicted RNase H-like HicB family nuclease